MDKDRLNHSYAVGKKMVEIGKKRGLSEEELKDLFVLGLNHDIGYEYTINGENHNIVGGELLRKNGFKYWKEVYYHGKITNEYNSLYLDILNCADMQIDKYGQDVGFTNRLTDIESRYGKDSVVLKRCIEMVKYFKSKNLIFEEKIEEKGMEKE